MAEAILASRNVWCVSLVLPPVGRINSIADIFLIARV